ncbi:hypothetical protein SNEBB_005957 [Seison nebaliae]|nr:hypothetical protein SNEBB_005957 [Seison nebaliae]
MEMNHEFIYRRNTFPTHTLNNYPKIDSEMNDISDVTIRPRYENQKNTIRHEYPKNEKEEALYSFYHSIRRRPKDDKEEKK